MATLEREVWDPEGSPLLRPISSLVAVHRLREVSCLYGFTRLEPSASASDGIEDIGLAVEGAPLGSAPRWLPAVEQFGEGLFLTLDPAALSRWLDLPGVRERTATPSAGVDQWARAREARGMRGERAELGERTRPEYVLAHSLAHALMTEIVLDCGYPASAVKERIYVLHRGPAARVGLLVYTAAAGSKGTLGGLVEVAHRFSRVLRAALRKLDLCSGDPVCADHAPGTADEDRALHGAACHGCLLITETSCESRNAAAMSSRR